MKICKQYFLKSRLVLLALGFFIFCSCVDAKPIMDLSSPIMNVYSDQTAHQVGDIITIKVSDVLTSNKNAQVKIKKDFSIPIPTGGGLFHFLGGILSGGGSTKADSQRQFQDSDTLLYNFAVRVTDVRPNGDLIVSGTHEVVFNNEKQMLNLSGIVRQKDIDSTNSVFSSQVADLRVDVQKKGNSDGILSKILRFLF